ncbi:hypothetical protein R6Q59_014052 [Mikania micrantha]
MILILLQNPKTLRLVYTITGIQCKSLTCVGIRVKLFLLNAKGYKVMAHIDGTPTPEKTNPLYETLSYNLLLHVLQTNSTAH